MGFAAIAACEGPDETTLMVACSSSQHICNRLLVFSADFSTKIGGIDISPLYSIRSINYCKQLRILTVINGGGKEAEAEEVLLYKL